MNKRGQFYLLAAIVIIAIIVSFAAVSNNLRKKDNLRIYDLGNELGIEGGEVIRFGTYNQNVEVDQKLKEFTELYSLYAGKGKSLFFVFGNTDLVTIAGYQELTAGTISVGLGSGSDSALIIEQNQYVSTTVVPNGNKIDVTFNGIDYSFDLNFGENFYFIISQEVGGDTFVAQG